MNNILPADNIFIDLPSLELIFEHVKNGITITDEHSTILYTNPEFTRITGYSKEDVLGGNPGMLHSGRHDESFYRNMWNSILSKGFWEGEIWNRRKSGEIYPELLTISKIKQASSDSIFYIAVFSDVSFLVEDIDHTMHLAFYDPLTELPNRTLYLDRVKNVIQSAKDHPDFMAAIMFMDLDKFKPVNDTYGHVVGDKLLKMVGQRLSALTRSGDTIPRIGGDEFAGILAANCNKELADHIAKRIIDAIQAPFQIDGRDIHVSISIGVSLYPVNSTNFDALIANADKAMYTAKKSGTKIAFYDSRMG